MTFDFFEGAAGTGKTYSLVGRAREIVRQGALVEGQRLLALTFMNGARRRLDARLSDVPEFHRRFDCQTFDVFARTVATRRRSLITPEMEASVATLNEFDEPCSLAASLLQNEVVRQWVTRTFPLVLVDEAQDLDEPRFGILRALSQSSQVVAAADQFQCLHDGRDTATMIEWLENAGQTHRLTQPHRTTQQGLLDAALAVREGRNIRSVLTASTYKDRTTWRGEGFRLLEVPARPQLLSWSISNEMAQRRGQFVILTTDGRNQIVQASIQTVGTRQYARKRNGATFGPYPITWDRYDDQESDALLDGVALPDAASVADFRAILSPLTNHAAIRQVIARMDRLRRVSGQANFTAPQVTEFVREALRNRSRLGFRQPTGHLAMTIQRAKNREFPNVIVLWPHTATGDAEHLRRLLYNGITRAQNHCTVIVMGQNRLDAPPFAPTAELHA